MPRVTPGQRRVLLVAAAAAPLVVFAWMALSLALVHTTLGYDESIYAVGGRSWITGAHLDHYPLYRPVGMRLLAAPGWLLGGAPTDFRVFAAGYATLCMITVWAFGRRFVGGAAATLALALLCTSVELQLNAAELLSDLPSLAFVFAVLIVVVRELERDGGPRAGFVLAGPFAAAAFYLRYGSTMILMMIAVAAAIAYAPVVKRHGRLVAITAAVFAACMVPHLLHAMSLTDSPVGVMRAANQVAGRRYYGEGLWFLYRHFPDKPGGLVVAVVAFIGLGSGLVHLIKLRTDAEHRRIGFAWLAATLHTLMVGFDVHGEPRFVFFGLFLYTLIGARALIRLAEPAPRRRVLEVAIPLTLVLWLIAREGHRDAIHHTQRDLRAGAVLEEAARVIRADAHGEPCAVMSPLVPQMTWLTDCAPFSISSKTSPWIFARMRERGAAHEYVVTLADAPRNPTGERLADVMSRVELPALATIPDEAGVWGDAVVYRVRP